MAASPRYRILPHTADGKFQAYGSTLGEAFRNAALALASLMWDWSTVKPRLRRECRVTANDRKQLLVRFLGEIVYLFDTERFLLGSVQDLEIARGEGGRFELRAALEGELLGENHEIYGGVKAVTYHDLKIEECDGFTVQVVVDM